MCFSCSANLSIKDPILKIIDRGIIINIHMFSFKETLHFLSDSKTNNIFTKSRPLADDFFYADMQTNGQTDIKWYIHFRILF
jgi:predicted AAA+ superfamily ATPase